VLSYSASADPSTSPDANSGTAEVWSTSFTGSAGSFIGNSANNGSGSGAGAGTNAWAIYAPDSSSQSKATASISTLAGKPLNQVGESVAIDFDNGWIDGNEVVIEFLSSTNSVVATFGFRAGTSNYFLSDSTFTDTLKPFTADGFRVTLSLNNSSGGYSLTAGATTLNSRILGASATEIAGISVVNRDAGGGQERDVYFNNLTITSVPEASAFLSLAAALTAVIGCRHIARRDRSAALR
jgi:hypothetical protein